MIEPATYSPGQEANRYRPAFPWKKGALFVVVVIAAISAYKWRQSVRAETVRSELQAMYDAQVAPVLSPFLETRATCEQLALRGRQDAGDRFVDDTLRISSLHGKRIAYLQVMHPALRDAGTLRSAIETQEDDMIGACLGVALEPLHFVTKVPRVLEANWLTDAERTNDVLRMEIRREQLARAIERQLPVVARRAPVDYFLLVVVQGRDRAKDPVDVYMWDLQAKKPVLRMRTEPTGRLITVRNDVGGTSTSPRGVADGAEAAADCSIAGQIKTVLGEPTAALGR